MIIEPVNRSTRLGTIVYNQYYEQKCVLVGNKSKLDACSGNEMSPG